MSCSAFNGSVCNVTGDSCMFLIPNSKLCVEVYGEGPDADQDRCENCKYFFIKDGKIMSELIGETAPEKIESFIQGSLK